MSDRLDRSGTDLTSDPGTSVSEAYRVAFEEAGGGTFVADARGRVLVANPAMVDILDLDEASVIGTDWRQLLLRSMPAHRIDPLHARLRDHHEWRDRVVTTDPEGRERILDLDLRLSPVSQHSAPDVATEHADQPESMDDELMVGFVSDVTDDRSIEDELHERARRDDLSGLLNRAGFLEILGERFAEARRAGNSLSVLYIDLDNFKSLSDHFGHRYGDLLLQSFARRLRGSLKSSDVIGRIGGDEFVVLFDPALAPTAMDNVVSKLKKRLLEDYQLDDVAYTCAASFGSAGIRLTLRMLDQVVVHMRAFVALTGPISVSVNLSAAQIRSEDVMLHIEQLAERYPDELARLCVELTESAFHDGDPVVETNLSRILATGAKLSLDDFGTGHSSLLSLRAHDFWQVKVDQRFLSAATSGISDDRMIFETMIELCRKLGFQTVCKGVETDAQLAYLSSLGCDVRASCSLDPCPRKTSAPCSAPPEPGPPQRRSSRVSAARS